MEKGLASTPGRSVDEAEEVLQALVERSGLLRPASDDRIDFLHNTLKEYLAAGKVVGIGDSQILAQHADDPAWQPVILFALAIAPEQFSSALVGKLLNHVLTNRSVRKTRALSRAEKKALASDKSRRFFLVRCRATAKQLAADLSNTIDGFLKNLLPPASMNEAEALALLGPKILLYGTKTLEKGAWWATQNSYMVTRCLRLLRLVGGERAKAALKTISVLLADTTQVTNEWVLACSELSPEEHLPWPFYNKTTVNLSSPRITDLSLLEDLLELRRLRLDGTNITSLSPLIKLTALQSLELWCTPVSDLKPLAELASLKELVLFGTQAVDLSPLRGIIGLKELDCDLTKVHDLSPIAGLISLESLDISRTPIVNIKPLKDLVNLKRLSMHGTKVTEIDPLQEMTALQSLDLKNTAVKDISVLSNLTSLQNINLSGTQVIEIDPLQEMTALQSLDLENTAVENISVLSNLTSLQNLDLSGTKVTNIEPLKHSISIKTIRLNRVLINDLSPLADLSSLDRLYLNQINVTDLSPLSKIKSLKHIHLGKTAILKQELENFKKLRPDILIH